MIGLKNDNLVAVLSILIKIIASSHMKYNLISYVLKISAETVEVTIFKACQNYFK